MKDDEKRNIDCLRHLEILGTEDFLPQKQIQTRLKKNMQPIIDQIVQPPVRKKVIPFVWFASTAKKKEDVQAVHGFSYGQYGNRDEQVIGERVVDKKEDNSSYSDIHHEIKKPLDIDIVPGRTNKRKEIDDQQRNPEGSS